MHYSVDLIAEPMPGQPRGPLTEAVRSALLPGLGQLAQGRPVTAFLQFGTMAAYVATAVGTGTHRAAWLAIPWNVWSAIEAYIYERVGCASVPTNLLTSPLSRARTTPP